jgi:glycosyltransferase involved in cell wall biosynthesis
MRILLITETVPYPLDGGGRIKTWHTLEALGREHEVHLHAFVRTAQQREQAAGPLSRICASVTLHLVPRSVPREAAYLVRSLRQRLPLTVVRHYTAEAMRMVEAHCRDVRIEAIYCDHLSMLEYGRRLALPLVHDAHNVEHRLVRRYAHSLGRADARRLLFDREAGLLHDYEASVYARCALIFAVSEVDAETIRALAPGVPVVPVPIAVDARALAPVDRLTDAPEILFVGPQDWPPNAEAVEFFLQAIWPTVRAKVPGARVTVVGRGEGAARARWRHDAAVEFTGWVEDVEPWFRRSRAMVVPLRSGSGMRVKILDALARGVPVVTTTVGVEGIAATDGEHVLVADAPAAFAAAVVRVLEDRTVAERLSRAGRSLAIRSYDTSAVARLQLEALRRFEARPPRTGSLASEPTHA